MSQNYHFASKTLVTQDEIFNRMKEVAKCIADDYSDKGLQYVDNPLVLICVLKGSFMFAADFCRMLGDNGVPVRMEFICASSYGDGVSSSGQVRMLLDTRHSIEGKHVLIVEDIIDSAITMRYIKRIFNARRPASLKTVVLLDKPEGRKMPFKAEYVVLAVPNEFVIGYGLDFDESFREIRDVVVMDPKFYQDIIKKREQQKKQSLKSSGLTLRTGSFIVKRKE